MLSYSDILSLRIRGCNLINPHIMIFVTLLSLSLILKNYYMCVCVINVIKSSTIMIT